MTDSNQLYSKGLAQAKQKHYSNSISTFTLCIKAHPQQVDKVYNSRGYDYYRLAQYSRAFIDFTNAIALGHYPFGDKDTYYYNRARVFSKVGDYRNAVHDLNRSLKVNPDCGAAYSLRSLCYGFLGQQKESRLDSQIYESLKRSVPPFLDPKSRVSQLIRSRKPKQYKLNLFGTKRQKHHQSQRPVKTVNHVDYWKRLHNLVGLDSVKKELAELIATQKVHRALAKSKLKPRTMPTFNNFVFTGNPGTGKTMVAKLFSHLLYQNGLIRRNYFKSVSSKDLVSQYMGKTAQKTDRVIRDSLGGVLLIDEAYALTPRHGTYNHEALDQIVNDVSKYGNQLTIIMAGYPNSMRDLFRKGNPGLVSRFNHWVHFQDYSDQQLLEILNQKVTAAHLIISSGRNLKRSVSYALATGFVDTANVARHDHLFVKLGNGRFVKNFVQQLKNCHDYRLVKQHNVNRLPAANLLKISHDDVRSTVSNVMEKLKLLR